MNDSLPAMPSVLVVCAHPDDESFGLGAILSALADTGSRVSVLCFTHGEASTLHGVAGELAAIRADELAAAGAILGVTHVELLDYLDGHLAAQPPARLADHVTRAARTVDAAALLVFDNGGITGHPDHQHATDAALRAAGPLGCPVLAWAIPDKVAQLLGIGVDADDSGVLVVEGRAEAAGAAAGVKDAVAGEVAGGMKKSGRCHCKGESAPGCVEPGVEVHGVDGVAGPCGRVAGLDLGRGSSGHRRVGGGLPRGRVSHGARCCAQVEHARAGDPVQDPRAVAAGGDEPGPRSGPR
jgi:LmbE family N-acetylglucosaminyl deacetylase